MVAEILRNLGNKYHYNYRIDIFSIKWYTIQAVNIKNLQNIRLIWEEIAFFLAELQIESFLVNVKDVTLNAFRKILHFL